MSVAFGPKGGIAAAYDRRLNGGVVVFDADPVSWQRKAERTANRNLTWQEWRTYFPDPDSTYRRTVRAFPWPHDLPAKEKEAAELYERLHPEEVDAF